MCVWVWWVGGWGTAAGVPEVEIMHPETCWHRWVGVVWTASTRPSWKCPSILTRRPNRPPLFTTHPWRFLQLLEQRDQAKLEMFFKSYGAPEAAAMCILLATAGPPQASAAVVAQAKAALDNPRLCGEPQLRDAAEGSGGGAVGAFGAAAAPAGGADDGVAAGVLGGVAQEGWVGACAAHACTLAR